jgi:hypothetical protein
MLVHATHVLPMLLWCFAACSVQAEAANQMIEREFEPAVKASIFRMRNMIESACYNLKKQEVKRAAVAGDLARYLCCCCGLACAVGSSSALYVLHSYSCLA